MDQKKLEIPFKLVNIEETQFSTFEEALDLDGAIQENINVGFGVDVVKNVILCNVEYQLDKNEQPLLKVAAACYFEIESKSFKNKLQQEKAVMLPSVFAKHLAVLTTGTLRGILYANTKGTPFNKFLMRLVNIDEMFVEDIEISL